VNHVAQKYPSFDATHFGRGYRSLRGWRTLLSTSSRSQRSSRSMLGMPRPDGRIPDYNHRLRPHPSCRFGCETAYRCRLSCSPSSAAGPDGFRISYPLVECHLQSSYRTRSCCVRAHDRDRDGDGVVPANVTETRFSLIRCKRGSQPEFNPRRNAAGHNSGGMRGPARRSDKQRLSFPSSEGLSGVWNGQCSRGRLRD